MKRQIFISLFSVAVLSACQRTETQVATDTTPAVTESTAPTTQSAPATAPYDLQFIDTMSKHHQMAVDMTEMGQQKFQHQELKNVGKKIIDDQTKEIAQLRQWRDQWYPGAPAAENMEMPGMSMNMDMSHMQSMSGAALDLMFIDMMIPHHQGALDMGRDALAKAEHPELKAFAQKVIDAQTMEIDQMQKWKKAWTK